MTHSPDEGDMMLNSIRPEAIVKAKFIALL
jgi:hypothetical protein